MAGRRRPTLSSCTLMSNSMRLAPTENCGVVGNDERVEAIARAAGLRVCKDQVMCRRQRFILLWNSMQADSITKIDQRGSGIFSDDAIRFFFATVTEHDTGWELLPCCRFLPGRSKARLSVDFGSSAYQDFFPAARSFSTLAATACLLFHAATVASTPAASQSSKGPNSQ